MKKRIWIALLPVTLLWCGCTEAENKYEHAREITAVASASDVIVSQSTRAAITDTSFDGKSARVLATTTATEGKGEYSTLHCNGIMTFEGEDDVARYIPGWRGNNSFPDTGDPTIWLSGLYPAEGWVGITDGDAQTDFPTINGATVTHTLDGKTDLMYAPEDDTKRDGHAELTFNHLLTLLNIKLVKVGTGQIYVNKISLVKTAGDADGKLNTVCSVALNNPPTNAVSFSGGTSDTIHCWLTDVAEETKFDDLNREPERYEKPEDAPVEAYILAPPLMAEQVGGVDKVKDYTLEVEFDCGGEILTQEVDLNLKKEENDVETDYDAPTAGCSFDITLKFSIGDIDATAKITGWDPVGAGEAIALKPVFPEVTYQEPTGAIDGLTNCYMVKSGEQLAFPVSRAYNWENEDFTNTLRATGEEYTDEFTVEVLWRDADVVMQKYPKIQDKGKDAQVWVRTKEGVAGNAVLAIRKKDESKEIVWSYHIWVTAYNPENENTTNTQSNLTFMSRNLGAMADDLSIAAYGLYYQWGRKDPFPGVDNPGGVTGAITLTDTSSEVGKVSYSIQHPATFIFASTSPWDWHYGSRDNTLWGQGTDKSVYDPCPSGWRVPGFTTLNAAGSPWKGFTHENGAWVSDGGKGRDWSSADGLLSLKQYGAYPAAGYRHRGSGKRTSSGSYGFVWSCAVSGADGYNLSFDAMSSVNPMHSSPRANGRSVRCVRE